MNKKIWGGILQAIGIMVGGGLGGFCAFLGVIVYPSSGLSFPVISAVIFVVIGLLLFLLGRNLVRSADRDRS